MKALLLALLLAMVVTAMVSGCVRQTPDGGGQDQMTAGDNEAAAYSQIEQELEQATENMDLGDLEDSLTE